MSPTYDHHVEHAAAHLVRAEASARHEPNGVHPRALELSAWLRIQHWSRLAHAHRHHLHRWYLHTATEAICTCGLLHPLPPPPVLQVTGHRNPQTWNPTTLLIVDATIPSDPPHVSGLQPQHCAVCQDCHYRSPPLPLSEALAARLTHAVAGCRDPDKHPRP